MPYPKTAIVIGGSISGLLQGLQLKRNGTTVTLLEQDPINHRPSHDSGVQIGPSVVRLLEKYDATGRPAAVPARFLSVAWRRERLRVLDVVAPRQMSNWATLYLILRANFDGLVSEMVPVPPEGRKGDGRVVYRAGKRVVGLSYEGGGRCEEEIDEEKEKEKVGGEGMMYVDFEDVTTGEKERMGAEVVIAADGVHSTVRKILGAGEDKKYSGYIGWRGTVPEHMVSPETVEYFSNRLNFSLMKGTYAITYIIPTETGHITPGNRLINWVWYFRVPDNSPAMAAIFTDIHNKPHAHTVPQGLIQPDLWADQKAHFLPLMHRHLAEIISKTARPFVSKVVDRDCTGPAISAATAENSRGQGSFFNGRLILVGDAYTAFRPHMGMASEQAARHCWQMDAVWRGEMMLAERDREAARYARRFVLLNRVIGLLGMGYWGQLVVTIVAFVGFLVGCGLGVY